MAGKLAVLSDAAPLASAQIAARNPFMDILQL
jgi:hypothetical protein